MDLSVQVNNCHHGGGLEIFRNGRPFPRGVAIDPETFVAVAQKAEQMGLHSVWVGDHIILPETSGGWMHARSQEETTTLRPEVPIFDPLAVLAFLAAHTTSVRLGVGVLIIPYRHPVVTAKSLATIDALSGGRLLVGAGVGWVEGEFEALGVPFETRGAMTNEYLELMRVLWTQDMPTFAGRFYSLTGNFHFQPKPVHGSIPIWVGGHSLAALRRAARLGDAYLSSYGTFDEHRSRRAKLHELLEEAGRDPATFPIATRFRFYVTDESYPDAPPGIGTPAKIADDIKRIEELGYDHLNLAPPPGPTRGALLHQMRLFEEEIEPRLSRARH